VIAPLLSRDRQATNFTPLFCCNGDMIRHATITSNAGGVVTACIWWRAGPHQYRFLMRRSICIPHRPIFYFRRRSHAGIRFKRESNQHFNIANNALTPADLVTY
jgi:hypothetical protein